MKKAKKLLKLCCCLCSLKEFSTRVKTSFTHVIASLIHAASKPLIMKSFWCLRWLYVSTIHRAWRGFKLLIARDTLTSPDATVFDNSISIPCVELVWDKFLCWLIDANIQKLELVREILWYNNQLSYSLHIIVSFLRCLDLWNYP